MDIYHKWKNLLDNEEKRNEWIEFYQKNDPIFNAAMDFCNQKECDDKTALELTLIAILAEKVKTLTKEHQMAHYMTRPLPTKLKQGQSSYTEDVVNFGVAARSE